MNYEILYPGPFAMLKVRLALGETIKAESGAMVAMSESLDIEGKMEGGVLRGIGRVLAGDTFFLQTVAARRAPGEVMLAHSIPGELHALELDGRTNYILQKDGFFAGSSDLEISTKAQSLTKGLFSGEGFFVLKVGGRGTLFVSSYGAIHPIDLAAGQSIVIDNSHLVAWPEGMNYQIQKSSSGWISSFTSGEGLVCRFQGPGRVLIQTRNPRGFGAWVGKVAPSK